MSDEKFFSKDNWSKISQELSGTAQSWWIKHQEDLFELGREEIEAIVNDLRTGDTVAAKTEIALAWARDDRAAWEAYRDGTTQQLEGIAARRVRLMEAIEDLTMRVAKVLGRVIKNVLGFP